MKSIHSQSNHSSKLEYLKQMHAVADDAFPKVLNAFSTPHLISDTADKYPGVFIDQLNQLSDKIHELDNRCVSEPVTSDHNAIFAPIWEMLNKDIITPIAKLISVLEANPLCVGGITYNMYEISNTLKHLEDIYLAYKNIGATATRACGFVCSHCTNGKCTIVFANGISCDGSERCECYELPTNETEPWF